MGPSGWGKTYFSKSLPLDHLDELFVKPLTVVHYCNDAWQDGFREMQEEGVKFHESVPEQGQLKKWFPKEGGLLVLDDLMTKEGNDKEVLDLFTKHFHHCNITIIYLCQDMFPPSKCAKSISRNAHYVVAFKNPRDQLGLKNILLQAFPSWWQDFMEVCRKVTLRPYGYLALDLHPASDDNRRVFSHLLTYEGCIRFYHRKVKI